MYLTCPSSTEMSNLGSRSSNEARVLGVADLHRKHCTVPIKDEECISDSSFHASKLKVHPIAFSPVYANI